MSRRKSDMTNHVVYSGWMIKSPPEKKLMGPWKIFRAKWKKRYFVLSKPAQSLPGTYHLNYFSDENCRRLRGSIDLEQCAEIIESLDSDQFQYLLAIKTTHRGRDRTYFLATETEEQMSTWVRNLCSVCGMKPDEAPSDSDGSPQPPIREELPDRRPQTSQPIAVNPEIMSKPPIALASSISPPTRSSPGVRDRRQPLSATVPKPVAAPRKTDSEYIPLDSCFSGSSIKRTVRQDSVPDEEAPPPPPLAQKRLTPEPENDVFHPHNTYDIPPNINHHDDDEDGDDLYKVPPPRPPTSREAQEAYDVPPVHHHSPSTPRSSSSEKTDSAYSSGQMYDIPPARGDTLTQDDVYDVPPSSMAIPGNVSLDDVPPVRPPKPGNLQAPSIASQESYINLPPNSKVFNKVDINSVVMPGVPGMTTADLYDIPPVSCVDKVHSVKNMDSKENFLTATPPPPGQCGGREHQYINAFPGTVEDADVYLPMESAVKDADLPSRPRNSSSTDNDVEYTDMSGRSSFDDSFEARSIYDHPPPSRGTVPPPRPLKAAAGPENTIYSTPRTRSFKKKSDGSPVIKHRSPVPKPVYTNKSVLLPQRSDSHPDFSTSDEEDDDMGSTAVWGTTPPAPTNKDNELKYVDIDHDDGVDKEPVRSPHGQPASLTEYHEIDFVKTDALRNVKETVSVERSKEKNNT